ncbi:Ty3/gypsy retrotransposon protein [Quillaja saponaria]|uniref:Ty3/gypsy retrotransposon protein n=1 Tax=Quillaja saponaria TaxID=32244 RepID=A0AAD7KYU6_QUISA|nr:Ty3/gypsy retrotransposon protein [Quillaja saponaria]
MKVSGFIKKQGILVLIDSGSTHNFVDSNVIKRLGLKILPTKTLEVIVANGSKMTVTVACKQRQWKRCRVPFVVDFLVMPLGGYGVVLRVQWLPVRTKAMMVQIMAKEQEYDTELTDCIQLLSQEVNNTNLELLLSELVDIFEEPKGLPHVKQFNHRIVLKDSNLTVNQRAYIYGPLRKDVIETMVMEMMENKIMRPSSNLFASPIVLVKKKDNTWRFCVDYRKLNLLTIKNKFLIPIIKEPLDELNGAKFFSKLDLRNGYHQIRMNPDDIYKIAFRTYEDLYKFVVMPFRLSNALTISKG